MIRASPGDRERLQSKTKKSKSLYIYFAVVFVLVLLRSLQNIQNDMRIQSTEIHYLINFSFSGHLLWILLAPRVYFVHSLYDL